MINLFKKTKKENIKRKGFTILELLISISIFAFMTALLLAKYGTFNQGVILTNLAYDVALTIRNAQSYGLNVKSTGRLVNDFDKSTSGVGGGSYGVHFDTANPAQFIFFVDEDGDGLYTKNGTDSPKGSDIKTTIQRGSVIGGLCVVSSGSSCSPINGSVDITFARPDPDARIKANGNSTQYASAEIALKATDGSTKTVQVNSNGQISVK
jgi:prepilin-type N-terminal cleavage/methylation domain-containing protein